MCALTCEQGNQGPANSTDPPDALQALGKLLEQRIFFLTVALGHVAFLWHSRVLPLTFTITQHSAPAAADNEEIEANSKK